MVAGGGRHQKDMATPDQPAKRKLQSVSQIATVLRLECACVRVHTVVHTVETPPKWQENDLVSGGHGRAAKLGACVDWLRTSADKRMWSGRRAVVMVR